MISIYLLLFQETCVRPCPDQVASKQLQTSLNCTPLIFAFSSFFLNFSLTISSTHGHQAFDKCMLCTCKGQIKGQKNKKRFFELKVICHIIRVHFVPLTPIFVKCDCFDFVKLCILTNIKNSSYRVWHSDPSSWPGLFFLFTTAKVQKIIRITTVHWLHSFAQLLERRCQPAVDSTRENFHSS